MAYFRPSDPGKSEGYDVHWFWYAVGATIMLLLIVTEPTSITGSDYHSKQIHLDRLPWSSLPAVATWISYGAAFRACRVESVESCNDLDSETLGRVALGIHWRFVIWSGLVVGSILLCAKPGLTYDAVCYFILGAVVANGVIGILRRPPESLWD